MLRGLRLPCACCVLWKQACACFVFGPTKPRGAPQSEKEYYVRRYLDARTPDETFKKKVASRPNIRPMVERPRGSRSLFFVSLFQVSDSPGMNEAQPNPSCIEATQPLLNFQGCDRPLQLGQVLFICRRRRGRRRRRGKPMPRVSYLYCQSTPFLRSPRLVVIECKDHTI